MANVLIIDDDDRLQKLLEEYLKSYGFDVFRHGSGNGVNDLVKDIRPDIILLDYMLPGKDGMEVLRELRAEWNGPVIMLTAKGDPEDRIVGLELGADDYVSKPFNTRELMARMKAVLRRSQSGKEGEMETEHKKTGERVTAGGITLDPLSMKIECGEKKEELSKTEYLMMEALMKNPNTVLSRDTIMNIARGRDVMSFERSIDVHISKLRAKVENVCGDKNRIKTVWGTGYMFVS